MASILCRKPQLHSVQQLLLLLRTSRLCEGAPDACQMSCGVSRSSSSSSSTAPHGRAEDSLLKKVVNYLDEMDWNYKHQKNRPVINFLSPERMMTEHKEMLSLPDEPVREGVLLEDLKKVYELSVTSSHPRFYNQLFGRVHEESLAGSLLTDAINTSIYTYEVAPVFTVMERLAMQSFIGLFGFKDGEGVCTPGGSIGNMYAMSLARDAAFPEVRRLGAGAMPPVRIYTSDESHYSMLKGASFMGFGEAAVTMVAADSEGRMQVAALREQMEADVLKGVRPLMVVATAGTTVLGAYDPIAEVAAACAPHGAWLHVDACLGGSAVLSQRHRHLLTGCHLADSITWNPHKMLGVNLQCSLLLTRHRGALQSAHGTQAAYLFQPDKFYPSEFDIGDRVIQCGRKVDVLKLWAVWRALGRSGLGALVDRKFLLARQLADLLNQAAATDGAFELLSQPQSTNVLFWYVPPCLRGPQQQQHRDAAWWSRLDAVAPVLKQRMTLAGSMLIGYQRCAASNGVNCWRMVCSQDANTELDMRHILDEFRRLGEDICV